MVNRIPFKPYINGWHSFDDEKIWHDPSDPFSNHLEIVTGACGDDDDIVATVLYAGVPVMLMSAGPSLGEEEQYWVDEPEYSSRYLIFIQMFFHENVIGDFSLGPSEEEAGMEPRSVRCITDNLTMEQAYDEAAEQGNQGYQWVEFAGVVARAMYAAYPDVLIEPKGW